MTFTPPDYFESEINESDDGRELSIRGGKIEARVDREIFDADADYRKKLHKEVQARFRAVQVLTHQPYELSKLSMHILTPDGQQHEQIFPKSSALKITTNKFDQIYTDSEGKVRDTRKERVEAQV